MKNSYKFFLVCFCFMAGTLFLHFSAFDAFASENAWRPTYDLVLRWVNFFIMVFLIVKFAGKPLMDFLRGRKEEISSEIRHLETEREIISVKIKEAMTTLDESETRFAQIKENIVKQGESKKAEINSGASQESIMIIEKARQSAEFQLLKAKEKLRNDMIDQSFEIALEKIPQVITEQDKKNLVDNYVKDTAK
ncbi:MAG: F0F1 ATP synthase subunit B [Proteobacteria bacterium]|nr:F0F1 ATP synthase subunit B [Pseudomonadota bacterium]